MAASTPEMPQEAQASTKARILAAAETVFAEKGFDGASTREIAAAAGVNISSLHYHWESKGRLYFAVFQAIYDRIMGLVQTAMPSPDAPLSHSVVDRSMSGLFDFFADHPTVPKLLVRNLIEPVPSTVKIEQDILLPAWRRFAGWTEEYRPSNDEGRDWNMFMVTIYSVLLLFALDSSQFKTILGGSVHEPTIRDRARLQIIRLVRSLIA